MMSWEMCTTENANNVTAPFALEFRITVLAVTF